MVLNVEIEIVRAENGWVIQRGTSKSKTKFIFKTIKEAEEWLGNEMEKTQKLKIFMKNME